MKKSLLAITLVLSTLFGNAQSFRELFTEANLLTEDGYYGLAIPLWETLLAMEPDNANLNFKLGKCYISQGIDRYKALPYLESATSNIKAIYDPFTADFKGAPQETYYYLALAHHIENDLDKAEKFYQKFLDEGSKKHILRDDAERGLKELAVARKLMSEPLDVKVKNLGGPINSSFAEYSPITALDENTIYFTSRRLRPDSSNTRDMEPTTGLYFEDMYVSYRNINGKWMNPELLPMNIPGEHSSVVSMSKDGQTLFIYRIYNGVGNIYESSFEIGKGWTTPALVGGDVNSTHNEFFAAISADENILYFVSDRPGGLGGKDIWYAKKLPNGQWGKAINMGAPINTPQDEDAPFIHPDGKTLYFASNGHETMGGYDIFYSQRISEFEWGQPKNMGYPINSTDNDHSFITSPSGKRGYYASRGKTGLGSTDIYVIDFSENERKKPEVDMAAYAVIKGFIYDPKTKTVPDGIRININNHETKALEGIARPVKRNGSFVFIVSSGETYDIEYYMGTSQLYEETLTIPSGTKYQEIQREIFLFNDDNKLDVVALDEETLGEVVKWKLKYPSKSNTFTIGSRVLYLDGDGNVLDTAYVSKEGYFEFKKLSAEYILKPLLEEGDPNELFVELIDDQSSTKAITMIAVDGVFYEKGKEPKLVTVSQAETDTEAGKKRKPFLAQYSKKQVKSKASATQYDKSVTIYLNFNQVEIPVDEPDFLAAVELLAYHIEKHPTQKVELVASASRLTTSQFKSNQELANERLQHFKSALAKALQDKGVDINTLSTLVDKAEVNGPVYNVNKGDLKSDFIEFQFVRVQTN